MPTFPTSPTVTMDVLLRQPVLISRALTDLSRKRFNIADAVFADAGPDAVAGGSARYQTSESIYTADDPIALALGAEFPRTIWTEAISTAVTNKYGLEFPVLYETIRRKQYDVMARGMRKVANRITRFMDARALAVLDAGGISTQALTTAWSAGGADPLKDISQAATTITTADEGYVADTVLMSDQTAHVFVNHANVRAVLPRETDLQYGRSGIIGTIQGKTIVQSPAVPAGFIYVLESKMVGSIADEALAPEEGYATYDVGDGLNKPVSVRTYEEIQKSQWVVRGLRVPAMWVAEPLSCVKVAIA